MSKAQKKTSRMTRALSKTADDMRRGGLIDEAAHEKIAMRHIGAQGLPQIAPLTAKT